jgi:predicted PurR-regulated permease PerM
LLPTYDDLNKRLQELSPLDVDISQRYIRKTTVMITSMVKGVFLVALIQGLVMGFFFWLARIPFTWFLTILSIAFAVLPAVGISFIVLPLAVILLLSGQTGPALLILFGFYGVVNIIDTILRPKLVSKEAYLNFALILIAIFGGLQLAGLLGIIYGPVVMILFMTTIEIYEEHYAIRAKAPQGDDSLEDDDAGIDTQSQAEMPA